MFVRIGDYSDHHRYPLARRGPRLIDKDVSQWPISPKEAAKNCLRAAVSPHHSGLPMGTQSITSPFGRRRHAENYQDRHHRQARETADDGVRADVKQGWTKKGRNIWLRPVFHF